MRIQVLILATFVGTAYAQSPTPATSDASSQQTAAAASKPATPATSCDDKTAANAKDKAKGTKGELDPCVADLGDLQKAGYKIKKQNGETLYCRKDNETGSRVKSNTICLTAEQLREIQANTRAGMREMTRQAGAEGN